VKRVVVIVLAAFALFLLTGCGTAVPDVKGMTIEQATAAIESAGFEVGKTAYDEKASGSVGAVISQSPAGGKRAKEGSFVALTVAGPPPVETPDLSGLDKGEAQAALGAVGLTLGGVTESYDASVAAGMVTSQTPLPGESAPGRSAVALVLSKGPEPVAVPLVTGKTQADATKLLAAAGFKITAVSKHDNAAKGIVIAQNPAAGAMVLPGTPVSITVSTGVLLVKVPRVHGIEVDEAERRVRAAGLVPNVLESVNPDGPIYVGEFSIYKQDPAGGKLVPKGSTVRIWYWWHTPE